MCIAHEKPGSSQQIEQVLGVKHTPSADKRDDGKKERIDAIRKGLKPMLTHLAADHPDNRPQILFDRKCVRTKYDFENNRYPEKRIQDGTNTAELPMKKDDHSIEAIGRYYAWKGTPAEEAQATRQSTANLRG